MPKDQLDQLIHALWAYVPWLVLAVIGAGLLGLLFKWLEHVLIRAVRSARAARQRSNNVANTNVGFAHGAPHCPVCNSQMIARKARRGSRAGQEFWGCQNYPTCRGTRPI